MNFAALRIYTRHDVLDGAVLARGVRPLEDDKYAPSPVRVEPLLQLLQPGNAVREHILDFGGIRGGPEAFVRLVPRKPEVPRLADTAVPENFFDLHCLPPRTRRERRLSAPNAFKKGYDESGNLRREITAIPYNADIGEFRVRARGEIAHDARAKVLRLLD
jgi:hypothetical protein